MADLLRYDIYRLFLEGEVKASEFSLPNGDYASLLNPAEARSIKRANLVVREDVRLEFEQAVLGTLSQAEPEKPDLIKIIEAHLEETITNNPDIDKLIDNFIQKRNSQTLATDQLLNAIFMVKKGAISTQDDLISQLLKDLGTIEDE